MLRLLSLFLITLSACHSAPSTEQVLITLTGHPGEMAVSWVSMGSNPADESVSYGVSESSLASQHHCQFQRL